MNFEKLTAILNEQGIKCCPICGTPFPPYNSRQKTCGDEECMRKYHSNYVLEYNRRRREENPEACRKYNREKMRKYRRKQKIAESLEEQESYWKDRADVNKNITGIDYGKRSAEKTLAQVPKIDVNIGEPKGGKE